MTKDRTTSASRAATQAPTPISRRTRIAAVTVTTGLLMTTTAVGIAAVTEAFNSNSSSITSAEAAVSVPVQITPTLTSAASLPDLSKMPALPSIKKILKSAPKRTAVVAAPQAPVAQTVAAPVESTPTVTHDQGENEHEQGENEGDD